MTLKPGVGLQEVADQVDRIANALIKMNQKVGSLEGRVRDLTQENESLKGDIAYLHARLRILERRTTE